ncbi:MAG: metal-dependent hydrolase, partial [Planctomycetes bacterium]|nr:metal-dependent hydrolase [Planctomycetota bacterium]
MDPLTHALLGAVISDAGFRRRLAPAATPFAMALATLPDLDAVTYWVSPLYAWSHHRGYTHSFFLQFLASPILGYLGWRLGKKSGSWLRWSGLALACLFSHTLLDLTGSWGVMPLLPFSNARISWDIAPIIDLFVFSTTASAFFANRLLRREKVAVPKNPLAYPIVHSYPGRQRAANWIGVAALLLLAVYLLIG